MFDTLLNIPPFLYLIFGVVLVILVIGWILLPFIMMNTNAYLRRVLREQQRTNELLESMRRPRSADVPVPGVRVGPHDK